MRLLSQPSTSLLLLAFIIAKGRLRRSLNCEEALEVPSSASNLLNFTKTYWPIQAHLTIKYVLGLHQSFRLFVADCERRMRKSIQTAYTIQTDNGS
jgi:hypothetical protein